MEASLLVVLLLGTLTITQVAEGSKARSSCPPGWFFYKANCYGYFRYPLSWSEAEYDCQSYGHGAHLASIMDSAEADIVASHISAYQRNQPVWIGLHDPEQNGRWKWNDGSMYNYRSWLAGQPDNNKKEEYCGELSCIEKFIKWNDSNCRLSKQYVCKYKP
ncbi:regenerating islet-derived protein 4 [Lithobates pipiens]